MVSDMADPGASTSAPPPTNPLEDTLRGMMAELQHLRAANEVLHSQVQGLLAQQQPILPREWPEHRPEPSLSGLKPKPNTFEGKESSRAGFLQLGIF